MNHYEVNWAVDSPWSVVYLPLRYAAVREIDLLSLARLCAAGRGVSQ